jgi:hypothetical protein
MTKLFNSCLPILSPHFLFNLIQQNLKINIIIIYFIHVTRIIIIKYINICNYQINKSNKFGNHSIQIQQDIYQFNHFVNYTLIFNRISLY